MLIHHCPTPVTNRNRCSTLAIHLVVQVDLFGLVDVDLVLVPPTVSTTPGLGTWQGSLDMWKWFLFDKFIDLNEINWGFHKTCILLAPSFSGCTVNDIRKGSIFGTSIPAVRRTGSYMHCSYRISIYQILIKSSTQLCSGTLICKWDWKEWM